MIKTPKELTEDWKMGTLRSNWYFVKTKAGFIQPMFYSHLNKEFTGELRKEVSRILATCEYDEYKAMQEELTEFKRSVTSYIGKPIDYDIACETVNKLLDDKEQLKKELESARWYQTIQNEDISKLRALLKGCKLSTFKIYDRLRFSDENEITPADLINAVDEIRPILRGILKSINAALGESKE